MITVLATAALAVVGPAVLLAVAAAVALRSPSGRAYIGRHR
jgi:hypothetical protein